VISARQTYVMLENQSLWNAATTCRDVLAAGGVPHAVIGGVAVCLHGYRRNTIDLDLLIRPADSGRVKALLEDAEFHWNEERVEFLSPSGIPVQFLLADDRAGKGSEVRLPDPGNAAALTEIEGLPVLSLAHLIEVKIACGEGNLRRTHRDFADVVELIAVHNLDGSFARFLHKAVRPAFRKLVRHVRDA
jgi:hypothetical protein